MYLGKSIVTVMLKSFNDEDRKDYEEDSHALYIRISRLVIFALLRRSSNVPVHPRLVPEAFDFQIGRAHV